MCIVVIWNPCFFICIPSRHLCPPLRVGHKWTRRAANEKTRASNNYNARKMSVIVIVNHLFSWGPNFIQYCMFKPFLQISHSKCQMTKMDKKTLGLIYAQYRVGTFFPGDLVKHDHLSRYEKLTKTKWSKF